MERSYDAKHTCAFLSYKGGDVRELTRCDGEMKRLLDQAADILEETKDEQGYYHAQGHLTRHLLDSMLYPVASQIASAVYDLKLAHRKQLREAAQAQDEE